MTIQNGLEEVIKDIRKTLDQQDQAREEILRLTRRTIRYCAESIKLLHRNKKQAAKEKLIKSREILNRLKALTDEFAGLNESSTIVAFQEYAEAQFLLSFKEGREFPSYTEMGVPMHAFLLGLADFVGEIRRWCLDSVRRVEEKKDLLPINNALELMDDIHSMLFSLDYPDRLLPGLRRKTDVTRKLVETTRGVITNASLVYRD